MDAKLKKLIQQWHIKAENDLTTANNEFKADKTVTDAICFHSQQSVEKYLKSYLIAQQIPIRNTHNITEILRLCIKIDADFRNLNFAIVLTNYAVEIRYPDDFYIPDIDEAKEAYEMALKVKEFVVSKIRLLIQENA